MTRPDLRTDLLITEKILSSGVRYLSATVILLFLLLLLAGALTIPFFFESPSMWYQFGVDKAILRTGEILGYSLTEGAVL